MKSSGRAQCPLSCDLEEERNGALQERGHQAEGAASAETLLWIRTPAVRSAANQALGEPIKGPLLFVSGGGGSGAL